MLRRELLERWRSRRAFVTLTVYLAVLGAVIYLLYRIGSTILSDSFGFGGSNLVTAGPVLGRFLLDSLLFFILLLVLFVAPGYAAAQLSGERERRTLPLLQITLLRPSAIVLGKLGASVAWLTLLVAAALPLGAGAFFLGGVAAGDLLRGIVYIVVIAVSIAGMALGISSATKRTTASVVLTFGTVLALTVGSIFLAITEAVMATDDPIDGDDMLVSLYLNPFVGLSDAARAAPDVGGFGMFLPSPLGLIAQALPQDGVGLAGPVEIDPVTGQPFGPLPPIGGDDGDSRPPVWLVVMGLYVGLGSLGLLVAERRVRSVQVSARLRTRQRRHRAQARTSEPAAPSASGSVAPTRGVPE